MWTPPFLPEWSYWVIVPCFGFLCYRRGWWVGYLWAAYHSPSSFRGWLARLHRWGFAGVENLTERPKHADVLRTSKTAGESE